MPRITLLFFCLLPTIARAQATPKTPDAPTSESKFSLTLYSTPDRYGSYATVREIRKLPLTRGENTIKFPDVAAKLDPTTVSFKSLTAPDTTSVVEQSFEHDVADADRLLTKYLGKNII